MSSNSADGQMLYIYDKDLSQVTERKLDASLGSSPAAILFGSNDLAKNFSLKEGGTKDGIDWVELTPRRKTPSSSASPSASARASWRAWSCAMPSATLRC